MTDRMKLDKAKLAGFLERAVEAQAGKSITTSERWLLVADQVEIMITAAICELERKRAELAA